MGTPTDGVSGRARMAAASWRRHPPRTFRSPMEGPTEPHHSGMARMAAAPFVSAVLTRSTAPWGARRMPQR
eukprot:6802909-Pyramimonas_sp.AAC.2